MKYDYKPKDYPSITLDESHKVVGRWILFNGIISVDFTKKPGWYLRLIMKVFLCRWEDIE